MKWFYNLKLATKIATLSIVTLVFLVITGVVGVINVSNENKLLSSLYENGMGHTINFMEAKSYLQDVRLGVRSHISTTDLSAKKSIEESMAKSELSVEKYLNELSSEHLTENEKKSIQELKTAYESYIKSKNVTIKYSDELKMDEAIKNADGDAKDKYENAIKVFDKLVDEQQMEAKAFYEDGEKMSKNSIFTFVTLNSSFNPHWNYPIHNYYPCCS